MADLLNFDWFKSHGEQSRLTEARLIDISSNLISFTNATAFQSGVCSIIANIVTKSEDLSEIRNMFLHLDKNNDGFLTLDELRDNYKDLAKICLVDERNVEKMLKACDDNGDGKIDYAEFIGAAYEKQLLLSGDNLHRVFSMLDADGNGSIEKEELKLAFGGAHLSTKGEQIWDEIMGEVDKNNDGVIQFSEFESAMLSILKQQVK